MDWWCESKLAKLPHRWPRCESATTCASFPPLKEPSERRAGEPQRRRLRGREFDDGDASANGGELRQPAVVALMLVAPRAPETWSAGFTSILVYDHPPGAEIALRRDKTVAIQR